MLANLFGWVGTVGLMLFYGPQLISLIRTPRVVGFNVFAWSCLFVAVIALALGAALTGWWSGAIANALSSICVAASIYYMRRKSR